MTIEQAAKLIEQGQELLSRQGQHFFVLQTDQALQDKTVKRIEESILKLGIKDFLILDGGLKMFRLEK